MSDESLPIDRGWAWVILAASFFIQLVTIGCLKSFGLIYTEFLDYFQTGAGTTAWVLSVCVFLLMSCGTLSATLGARFGFRAVLIAASILSCTGFVSSAFVQRVELLYLTVGVITGLAAGLAYTPTVVMVSIYFNKRRSFANGLAVAGNGVGYFLYPFLINYLLKEYALFGTMIIVGGVMLNSCVGAALMRPLESFKRGNETEMLTIETENHADKESGEDKTVQLNGPVEEDVMLAEMPQSRKRTKSQNRRLNCCKRLNVKDCFDYTYCFDPVFLLYAFSFSFANMSYSNLFVVVPPHAKLCEMTKDQVALLVSLSGLADLVGRIFFGWLSDLKFVRRRYVYVVAMFAGGGAALLAPFATEFTTIAIYACWYGLFGGSYWSLVAPLVTDSFGVEQISKVFGLTTTFISVPSLLAPPILGWLKDGTGNYDMSFRLAGIWMLIAGVLASLMPLAEGYKRKLSARRNDDDPVA